MLLNQNKVKSINDARNKKETVALYSVIDAADWYSTTFYIANILNLPLGPSLIDPNLSLIEGSLPEKLGHRNISEFITSARDEGGLGMNWDNWKRNVKAARFKQEFGINSQDIEDIIAQVDDVKLVIGRLPISSNEFNHGKSLIEKERLSQIKEEHKVELTSMKESVSGLMKQLDTEQSERHQAIEKMNDALNQIEALKSQQQLKDHSQNELMQDYVKRSMYESIIEQMNSTEIDFESTTQEYLDRILNLEQDKVALTHQLRIIKDQHARAVAKMNNSDYFIDESARNEVLNLKRRLASVLKDHVQERKKSQKLHIISTKQKRILSHYKKNTGNGESVVNKTNKTQMLGFITLIAASVGLLATSFLGII